MKVERSTVEARREWDEHHRKDVDPGFAEFEGRRQRGGTERNRVRTRETRAGWIGVNHETSASPKNRERRLNISEPNPPIGRGSTLRVGIDFQS